MDLTPAFVLHSRPYRESSLLVQLFTFGQGKISVVAKGGRGKRSPWRSALQPFVPLVVSFKGSSELKTLQHAEPTSLAYPLFSDALYSSLYLNELLYYLLAEADPQPEAFELYQETLLKLAREASAIEPALRRFELKLLALLGHGLTEPEKLEPTQRYHFWPGEGFILASDKVASQRCFLGEEVEMLCQFEPNNGVHLRLAKRFCRQTFGLLLEGRPLKSRELFIRMNSTSKK